MSLKRISLLLIVVMLFSMVAACGGAAPEPAPAEEGGAEAPAEEAEAPAEEAEAPDAAPASEEEAEAPDAAPASEEEAEVPEEEEAATTEEAEATEEEATEEEMAASDEVITLDTVIGTEPPTLDPALGTDTTSIFFIRQMFVGLAAFDEEANVIPALATDWEVSEDGLTWTFNLRDDIHWVHQDAEGNFEDLGPVTAQDVVYGITRTIDPNTASDYAYVLYIVEGAEALNTADPESDEYEEMLAGLGVNAPDDTTVEITLTQSAAYFPSIAAMWVTFPQPQAAIEEFGEQWTEAENIVTNGPYTLESWDHQAEIWLTKNPLWIEADEVQIERIGGPIIQEASTTLSLYENDEIDIMSEPPGWSPPIADLDRIKSDPELSEQLFIAPRLCTYYYGFITQKPPFDDPMVRKAFAAAIDRQSLIDNVTKGEQIPAHSFAPPGVFGNVADELDIGGFMVMEDFGDQVTQAQEWLAEAGYPEGEGLDIVLAHNTSEDHAQIAQAIQAMWQEAFPQAQITIENQEWAVYLDTLDPEAPMDEKPNIYRIGWCADYPDSNNWLNEVFHSQSGQNYAMFNSEEYDALVEEAAVETDPAERLEMYRQAEQILVQDVTAIAPIYYYTYVRMYKPWLEEVVISPVTGDPISEWRIDWEAKKAARGE